MMIENVPALVCDQCGMRYYDAEVVRGMERLIKRTGAATENIQVPVAKFETVA